MRVLSVQVGRPRMVEWHGKEIRTSIYKTPVDGKVQSVAHNLQGDEQSDPSVHGGEAKAVYAYPYEHYAYWEGVLNTKLPPGAFGENLTTEGLLETDVTVGDRFRIGTIELVATQPRMPCYKLGIRHVNDDMVRLFLAALKPGIYFQIAQHGELGSGDPIELALKANGVTMVDVMRSKIKSKLSE